MRARRDFSHVQRPIGVRGIRFRSKAEANYAAYLAMLERYHGIDSWEYEPQTFWFTPDAFPGRGVRRGVTSYRPDFFVKTRGKGEWREVKGYMDTRSKTALARMARYYPNEKVVVIDSAAMRTLKRQVGAFCPGWIP